MRTSRLTSMLIAAVVACVTSIAPAQTPLGNGMVYNGFLKSYNQPSNGTYDFQFRLFDAVTSGSQVGPALGVNGLQLTDGHFAVILDFGASAFQGDRRWLQVSVREFP